MQGAASAPVQSAAASYAEERAQIEDLRARYLFALDFKNHDLYVTTFTPEGILDIGTGPIVGHEAIKAAVANMPGGRHHITNVVIRIDGDKWLFARRRIYNEGRAEWAAPPVNPAW